MVRIVVDGDMRKQLVELDGPADLFDEVGRSLGRFVPASESDMADVTLAEVEAQCPHTPEELDILESRAARDPGRPLAEIWKDLGRT